MIIQRRFDSCTVMTRHVSFLYENVGGQKAVNDTIPSFRWLHRPDKTRYLHL